MAAIGIRAPARGDSQLWETAVLYMLSATTLFYASYGLANWAASQRAFVPTVMFGWEHRIPFLAWSIVPYWSLNIFYAASFFICRTRDELNRHMGRLVTAQVISVTLFLIFPLSFGLVRPETHGIAGELFGALDSFDQPFNQAPSLHLSLAVIVAARFRTHLSGFARRILAGWFVLVGASVLTTYQHHFIDIPTGLAVGALCCAFLPDVPLGKATQSRQTNLSAAYCTGALLLAGLGASLGGWGLWLLWPANSCLIVGAIYWQGRPALFQKVDGTIPLTLRWLLAPYIAAARINSWCWTRDEAAASEITDGVWLGRSSCRDPRIASVVDLAAELPTRFESVPYTLVPMLDLAVPSVEQIDSAVAAIERFRNCGPTLVCCALGYSRSALAVAAWLKATGRATSVNDAVAFINEKRRISLSPAHRARLQEWAHERIVPPRTRIARIVSSGLVLTARLVVGAEPRWAGCKPVARQRIYIANHTSHADFVVLWASLPPKLRERTHPVAAGDYWKHGPIRRFLACRVFDAVLIDRQHVARSHNVLEITRDALMEGKSLIVFPEGTRGTGSELNDFKCGIYHVARCRPDVEIVPVWISNMPRVLPRGTFVPAPFLSSVTFGRPLLLQEGEAKQDFLVRLRRAVIDTGETQVQLNIIWILGALTACLVLANAVGLRLQAHHGESASVINLNQRIQSWWGIVLLLGAAAIAGKMAMTLVFALFSFLALREFLTASSVESADRPAIFAIFLIALPLQYAFAGLGWERPFELFIPLGALLGLPVLTALTANPRNYLARTAELYFGLMICIYGVSHVPALLSLQIPNYQGRQMLLVVFLITVAQGNDVLQYVWGKLFGTHFLAPAISPSKTVEGLLGGLACSTVLGASLWWLTPFSIPQAAAFAFMIALTGSLGGLVLSAVKRDRGLKDWSHLVPGHGGVLDRLDSVCFSAPLFFHLVRSLFAQS